MKHRHVSLLIFWSHWCRQARLVLITSAIAVLSVTAGAASNAAAPTHAPRQSSPKAQLPPRSQSPAQRMHQPQSHEQQLNQYPYQQPLPRPLTEVLSSNVLVQMADLVAGRPSAIPPTLSAASGQRGPFNAQAARQAIAMTDSQHGQQVGTKGKGAGVAQPPFPLGPQATTRNTACARAIVVCCKPPSEQVPYGCFEALGCPGFFLNVNPCSSAIVRELAH